MTITVMCHACGQTLRFENQVRELQKKCPICHELVRLRDAVDEPDLEQFVEVEVVADRASLWYLQTPEGQVYGPAGRKELDDWVRQGRVADDCLLRRHGTNNWNSAALTYPEIAAITVPRSSPVESGDGRLCNPVEEPTMHGAGTATAFFTKSQRGSIVLLLGVAGFVAICPIFSVLAWVWGSADMREMKMGHMDYKGLRATQAGRMLGMVAALIWIVAAVIGIFVMLARI